MRGVRRKMSETRAPSAGARKSPHIGGPSGLGPALYHEWKELPTKETLKRQRENIAAVVQSPSLDRRMPPARINR